MSAEMVMADVLVVSDLHAMSLDVDVSRFRQFVEQHPARTLVLAGDTLDFYIWRHGRGRVDMAAGVEVLTFLNELAERGVKLVIMPGNHDLEWAWLVGGEVPRRYMRQMYPVEMQELMEQLVARENVAVQSVFMVDDTAIVHGHEGWHGDWLWRISEIGDRATRYKMVGGQMRRKVMGGAPLSVRAMAVSGHGFYRRLAAWGRKLGKHHVIHGHTHVHGRRMRFGITIDCLPAWRASEGPGGGMRLLGGVWENVGV